MTNFFKNDTPQRLAALEAKVIEQDKKLVTLESAFEDFRVNATKELDALHRIINEDSLKESKAAIPADAMATGGYKPWSVRKAERVMAATSPEFVNKVRPHKKSEG